MLCLLPLAAQAQPDQAVENWPNQGLKLIVPFPADGPTDVVARIIARQAGAELGQKILVQNRSPSLLMGKFHE